MSEAYNYDDIEFKEIDRKKKVRKKKHYLLRFLVFVCVCIGLVMFLRSDFFKVKTIEVKGNNYYTAEQVLNLSEAKTGENIFWSKMPGRIKSNLLKNPYYKEVKVKRVLPSKLVIELEEREQVAAAAYGEDYVVIDAEGIVLRKCGVDPKLTTLYGLTISRMEEGKRIEAEEKTTLDTTLKMISAMQQGDIFFKKIDMSKVVIKAYIYDTLVVKGTPKQIIASLEKGELQKVVNNLISQDTIRGTINMGEHNYMAFSPDF